MKRTLICLSLLAVVLLTVTACATATKPADIDGVITNIENNGALITVTPRAGGDATDITVPRSTRILWPNGLDAGRSDLIVGHPVQVWLSEGSKTATKISIARQ